MPAGEDLDDDHRRATMRTDEGGLDVGYGCLGRLRFGDGGDVQQFKRAGEMLAAFGIGEQPVVADAMKAGGQHVQQEAAHELIGTERHGLVARLPGGAVVLPVKGDASLVECEQSPIRNRPLAGETPGLSEPLGRALCSQRVVLNGRKRIIEVMKQLLPALIFG